MKLDFIERLGYYFFLSVGLIGIPYVILALTTSFLETSPDKVFFLSVLVGLVITNLLFSHLTIQQHKLKNVLISFFAAIVGMLFFQVTIILKEDDSLIYACLIMVVASLAFWEILFFVLRKINKQ